MAQQSVAGSDKYGSAEPYSIAREPQLERVEHGYWALPASIDEG
ncbi:hypothetical protein [Dictyobacter arantiisoli]|nr:hypothetical protein [Dictyobacter arantiisoli]